MADMKKVLGTMMATGLAGRAMRGPHFTRRGAGMPNTFLGGGGGMKQTAGLAALAYLGYRAYQDYQRNQQQRPQQPGDARTAPTQGGGLADILGGIFGGGASAPGSGSASAPGSGSTRTAGGGLGDRLADVLRGGRGAEPEPSPPPPPPEATLDDGKALLLVRAMITAAYADGELTAEERARIVGALDQAGAGPEEHRVIEAELGNPKPLDAILREVRDEETADQVYIASEIAIRDGSQTEKHYLSYLASRLKIPADRQAALDGMAGGTS